MYTIAYYNSKNKIEGFASYGPLSLPCSSNLKENKLIIFKTEETAKNWEVQNTLLRLGRTPIIMKKERAEHLQRFGC